MKAVRLIGPRKFEIADIPRPELTSENDVLIKVKKVGICGSDMHYYNDGKIGDQVIAFPFIIGHECSGVVEEVGRHINKVKPGDIVSVDPSLYCGECSQCREGRYHTCLNNKFLGCPGQLEGALTEYIVLPGECCFKGKADLSLEQAVLVEPLSIGFYATTFINAIAKKDIAVLGFGPIGMGVFLSATAKGTSNIIVTDKLNYRLEQAKRLNACAVVSPDKENVIEKAKDYFPDGLDVVFECCGKQEAIDEAVKILKPGGKLVIVGIPDEDIISFNPHVLRRREITIQNVRRQNHSVDSTIAMVENKLADIDFMITHQFDYTRTAEAFDLVNNYHDNVIKAVITF